MSFGPPNYAKSIARTNFLMNGGWKRVFWTLALKGAGWVGVGICIHFGWRTVG